MSNPQTGTKELTEVVDLVLSAVDVGKAALKDGKIDINDLSLLLTLVPSVGPAVENISKVPGELRDITEEEAVALAAHVMGKLSVDDPKARKIVEASLKTAVSVFGLVQAIAG